MNDKPIHIPLVASLFITLFLIVLSFTITSLASPYIVSDLGGDRTISFYALSFFGFGNVVTIPLAKPLGARFGEEKIFVYCVLAFAFASLLCALAPTFFFFVAARFCAGMASGPFYPLLAHYFSCLVPSPKRIVIAWVFVTMLVVVPVLGACWGGSIAYLYDWRIPFFLNAAAGIPLSWIIKTYLKDAEIEKLRSGFDWIGWAFYAVGICGIAFSLTTAQQIDWYRSDLFNMGLIVGIVCFGYYLLRSFTHETPVLALWMFGKPIFTLAILCLMILFAILYGMILLLSIWLTLDVRFTPLYIATLIGNMAIAGLFPRFIIEQRLGKIDPRIWIALATILLAISCFYTTTFDVLIDFQRIAISRVIAGFGLALFLPPIFQILSQSQKPDQWVDVFEIFQAARNFACGLGAALFSIAWQRRTSFYHERLGEKLIPGANPVDHFFEKVEQLHVPGDPPALLNELLSRRSSTLALDDIFYLMGWIMVGLFVLIAATFFIKRDAFNLSKAKYSVEN